MMKAMIQILAIASTLGAASMAYACDSCEAHKKAKVESPKDSKKKCCTKKKCPVDCEKKCCIKKECPVDCEKKCCIKKECPVDRAKKCCKDKEKKKAE